MIDDIVETRLDDDKKSVESFAPQKFALESFAIVVFQALDQIRQFLALDGHLVGQSGEGIIACGQVSRFGYDAFVRWRIGEKKRPLLASIDKDFHA